MLQTEDAPPKEKARIDRSYKELFKLYADLCRKNNLRLFVVLHPDRDETAQNTYFYDFTLIVDDMKSDTGLTVIDLLPSYRTYIAARKNTTAADYYWKLDGHHNSKGYLMMAETTLDNITPYLRDTIVTK